MKHKNIKIIIGSVLFICILGVTLTGAEAGGNAAELLSAQDVMELAITIEKPGDWTTGETEIPVTVNILSPSENTIVKTEARTDPNADWIDISVHMKVTVSKNCTVYVQVTDSKGNKYLKSRYIDRFDTEKPIVKAWIDGNLLRLEVSDNQTGIAAVYVNERAFIGIIQNTADIPLPECADRDDETINITAVDNAGNESDIYSLKNPLYDPSDHTGESEKQAPPTTATPTSSPAPLEDIPAAGGVEPEDELFDRSGTSVIPTDGSGTLLENNVKSSGEREFFTIETKNGNIFFIVIDKEKQEKNVYLLVEAAERDLIGFVDTATPAPTQSAISTPTPQVIVATPQPTEPPQPKNAGVNTGSVIILLLAVAGVGAAGYYFKIYKPNNQEDDGEEYDDDDDFDDDTDSEYDGSEDENDDDL